jgi:hypothetical protein
MDRLNYDSLAAFRSVKELDNKYYQQKGIWELTMNTISFRDSI